MTRALSGGDSAEGKRLDLRGLRQLIDTSDVHDVYEVLGYDYASEVGTDERHAGSHSRDGFISRMAWRREPTATEIRRLFNQVNSALAERWARESPQAKVSDFLSACNGLILWRQGKPLGARTQEIEFGIRMDREFLDPMRQFKQLRGLSVASIDEALGAWTEAVDAGFGDSSIALALAMAIIAIHPFVDGNGRLGRIAYSWLRARWNLGALWLAEDREGEVLRTGHGLGSTEHLMAAVMLLMCGGHNRVEYGERGAKSDAMALSAMKETLAGIRGEASLVGKEAFVNLREHLALGGHFVSTSPRFESLRSVLDSGAQADDGN